MVGVGWAYTYSSIFVLVCPAHLNTVRTFVLSFLAFKSRNYTNVYLLCQFPGEDERSHIWESSYWYRRMYACSYYTEIWWYHKEKGEEEGERKERDIYIYNLQVAPSCLRCCFLETTRAAFMCSCILYYILAFSTTMNLGSPVLGQTNIISVNQLGIPSSMAERCMTNGVLTQPIRMN